MSNELIFLVTTLGTFGFIRYAFSKGRLWLHTSIVVNLILISVFGAKLIQVFGLVTNVGNIFYAMVFFAGQLLVEHYGTGEGRRSVWIGFAPVVLFTALGQLVILYAGIPQSAGASAAISALFAFTPRLAVASLLAYLLAQSLNIAVYSRLRARRGSKIWVRSVLATAAGQMLDSVIFFSIAFGGIVPQSILLETMLTGFAVKLSLGVIGVPFLYSSYTIKTRQEVLKEETEAILFSIGDGLVITDRTGIVVLANKAFEEMTGWSVDDAVGKQMTDILKRYDEEGNEVPYTERVLTRVLTGEKVLMPMTNHTYFARKDGERFPVRIMVTPVIVDQTVVGAVEVFQDVTKEKMIEAMRSDFLSLASHQLRTPLSGTRWIIETLTNGTFGVIEGKQRAYLEELYRINSHMIQLVNDMLDTLRLEGGDMQVMKERFQLSDACKEVAEMLAAAAKEKHIIFRVPTTKNSPTEVETDRKALKHILTSLLSNAINYSKSGGTVTLAEAETDGDVTISVEDHGIGIPNGEQKRIFERFYRASNAGLTKVDGTGLGLYISSILARRIGATITFASTEGNGSVFRLHIPKAPAEAH